MNSSSGKLRLAPTAARSIACPPAIPREPDATASSFAISSCHGGIVRQAILAQAFEKQGFAARRRPARRSLRRIRRAGRLATPQHVVVHAREIVVDERIGVDQLDGGSGQRDTLRLGAGDFAGSEGQQRPHAFAPTQTA
jgi:hypothetical protein